MTGADADAGERDPDPEAATDGADVEEPVDPQTAAEALGRRSLPGDVTDVRVERVAALLADDPDPGAIEVFRAWHGGDPESRTDTTNQSAHGLRRGTAVDDGNGFDPVEDRAHNTTRVKVKGVYQRALEAGLDDEAAYLRQLPHPRQHEFARLLSIEYLDEDGGDDVAAGEEG